MATMVLRQARAGKRADADARAAVQIAVLVALALHASFAVWLLRDFHPAMPEVEQTEMVIIDVHPAPIHAKPTPVPHAHGRPMRGREGGETKAARESTHLASEPIPVAEGSRAASMRIDAPLASLAGTGADASPTPGDGTAGRNRVRFSAPKVVRRAPGDYPERAFREGAQGRAEVLVTIDAEGRLVQESIDSSSGNAALDEASLEVVRHYLFKAGERDGVAEQMDAYIDIGWTITPAVIRRYADNEGAPSLPPGIATKRAVTRFGSWMETTKKNAVERGE